MVENQHTKITGYRDLSEAEIALMNEIKTHASAVGALVERLRDRNAFPMTLDQRWVAIGATELQQGFMALTRAVAQPTSF